MGLHELDKTEKAFAVFMSAFVVVLVLTNVIGVKLFLAFHTVLPNGFFGEPITLTTGIITYPVTFLLTDVVCEVYGRKRANLMVLTGFGMSLLSLILIQIASIVPGSQVWPSGNPNFETVAEMQTAFDSVFSLPGILIFGSMTAYLVAQLTDVRLFHFIKRMTKDRHLWLRNNGSTMVSQLLDTVIVNSIFLGYGLGLEWVVVWKIIFASYVFKLLFAVIDAPFIYLGVFLLRRYLPRDTNSN